MKPRYVNFLDIICDKRYNVIPIEQFSTNLQPDRVNVLLRHDLDDDNGFGFIKEELSRGLKSTYYVMVNRSSVGHLLRCSYEFEEVASFYKAAEKDGFRFGYHFKDVDQVLGSKASRSLKPNQVSTEEMGLAIDSFRLNLRKLRKWIKIGSAAAHGGCCNWFLDSAEEWRKEWLTLCSEENIFSAYRIPFVKTGAKYVSISDTNPNPEFVRRGVFYFKDQLERLAPGDTIQILIHPFRPRWDYPVMDHL